LTEIEDAARELMLATECHCAEIWMLRRLHAPDCQAYLRGDVITLATAAGVDASPCPYSHSHTRHWCGHLMCRDS
jgi:hypothetical protein